MSMALWLLSELGIWASFFRSIICGGDWTVTAKAHEALPLSQISIEQSMPAALTVTGQQSALALQGMAGTIAKAPVIEAFQSACPVSKVYVFGGRSNDTLARSELIRPQPIANARGTATAR